jgi:hypothetical protein
MGHPWQDSPGMAAGTGQVNLDRTAWTGEPRQDREDYQDKTSTLGQQCQESCGQDCRGRIAGIGQPGRNSQDRTARKDSRSSTSRTGNKGQDCQNRIARIGQP